MLSRPTLIVTHLLAVLCLITALPNKAEAQFKDEIGWTQLIDEFGASLPDGSGISVSIVEAPDGNGAYFPDINNAEFADKSFFDGSGGQANGARGHGTRVGRTLFGTSTSIAPGIDDITVFEANDWINRVVGFATGEDPMMPLRNYEVQNHSWIGSATQAEAINILRRVDYMVNRDNTTMVVGTNNNPMEDPGRLVPQLLAHSYNTITVGLTNGQHAWGPTRFNGAGRIKPEIVAPESATSWATPLVASAAVLLRSGGAGTNATQNEVVKSLLLSGATKDEFASWSRTSTQPLDTRYGAGELNIYNSYTTMLAGEVDGSATEPGSFADVKGWDYESGLESGGELFYTVLATAQIAEVSIALTWNLDVFDGDDAVDIFDPQANPLADLNLELYDSSNVFRGSLLDSSISTDQNVEHIYMQDLAAGLYTIRVSHEGSGGGIFQDFGLSWRFEFGGNAIPEPTATWGLLVLGLGWSVRRRRR